MAEKQGGGRESFFLRINTRGKGGHIIIYMRAREEALCIYTRMRGRIHDLRQEFRSYFGAEDRDTLTTK